MIIKRTGLGSQKGYSLVEVMVAAGIGTGVILMMSMSMMVGTRGFDEANRRIDALVEARAALGILSDDVSTMVVAGEEEFGWEEADERFHEVWFLTLKPTESQDPNKAVGDVCYVHYFTAITPDAPVEDAALSRKLYRRFVSSGDILQELRDGVLPTPEADVDQAEAIAFNVTKFVAQPLVLPSPTDADIGGPLIEWSEETGLPVQLVIDFQVVDGDTAALMRNEEDWNLTTSIAQTLVLEEEEDKERSRKGRNFQQKLKIGHAN